MDSFIEKIAGKFGANDVIKANSEAEAKELETAKEKINELEKAVADMRRLSLKAVETEEATSQLVAGAIEKIEEFQAASPEGVTADFTPVTEELSALRSTIENSFKVSSEEAHKENVRVYRNVQAAVIEELKQQSEAISYQHAHIEKSMKGVKPCAILSLVFSGLAFLGVVGAVLYYIFVIGL